MKEREAGNALLLALLLASLTMLALASSWRIIREREKSVAVLFRAAVEERHLQETLAASLVRFPADSAGAQPFESAQLPVLKLSAARPSSNRLGRKHSYFFLSSAYGFPPRPDYAWLEDNYGTGGTNCECVQHKVSCVCLHEKLLSGSLFSRGGMLLPVGAAFVSMSADTVRLTALGTLQIKHILQLKSSRTTRIELIALDDIEIDEIAAADSPSSSLLIHSTFGEVKISKTSGFDFCRGGRQDKNAPFLRIEAALRIRVGTTAAEKELGCGLARDEGAWPNLKIVGQAVEEK